MALIPYPDPDTIGGADRAAIDHFASEHGRPTLLRIMLSYSPPAQQAMDGLYHPVVQSGVLPRPLKELLFAAASHARQCAYCMGGHSLFLVTEFGYDQPAVEAMRSGQQAEGFSEADRGLVALARRAAANPSAVTAEDLDAARHLGWSDAEIIEALAMACHAAWTNTFAQGLRLEDDLIAPEFAAYF
jgi:AhpD family alkylhydroperoxidase